MVSQPSIGAAGSLVCTPLPFTHNAQRALGAASWLFTIQGHWLILTMTKSLQGEYISQNVCEFFFEGC